LTVRIFLRGGSELSLSQKNSGFHESEPLSDTIADQMLCTEATKCAIVLLMQLSRSNLTGHSPTYISGLLRIVNFIKPGRQF
jgi:hypothetical protein